MNMIVLKSSVQTTTFTAVEVYVSAALNNVISKQANVCY